MFAIFQCQNDKKAAPGTNNEPESILFLHFFSYRSSVLTETIKSPASVINTEVIDLRVIIKVTIKVIYAKRFQFSITDKR